MPRNYDPELETALREAFGEDFESELEGPQPAPANQNVPAAGALARGLYTQYQKACKGRRILRTLRKQKLKPIDEALILEDRIQRLPDLFHDLAILNSARGLSPARHRLLYNRLIGVLGYPPGTYLGTLDDALAQAKCELAEARWRAVAAPERRLP
jgi:hypothetical protein